MGGGGGGRRWGSILVFAALEADALTADLLVGLVVKASASRAEDPGFHFRLRCGDFSGVESYQRLQNCHSGGCPVRRPAFIGSALGLVGLVSV